VRAASVADWRVVASAAGQASFVNREPPARAKLVELFALLLAGVASLPASTLPAIDVIKCGQAGASWKGGSKASPSVQSLIRLSTILINSILMLQLNPRGFR
jgi:hypothetical protein